MACFLLMTSYIYNKYVWIRVGESDSLWLAACRVQMSYSQKTTWRHKHGHNLLSLLWPGTSSPCCWWAESSLYIHRWSDKCSICSARTMRSWKHTPHFKLTLPEGILLPPERTEQKLSLWPGKVICGSRLYYTI